MKIFIGMDGNAVEKALERVLEFIENKAIVVESASEADVIIVGDTSQLRRYYETDKSFVLIAVDKPGHLPANVEYIPVTEVVADLLIYISERADSQPEVPEEVEVYKLGEQNEPKKQSDASLNILVVDDKSENLGKALELLGEEHFVTLAQRYSEAEKLIEEGNYDVVISDCQMPVDVSDSALSITSADIGQIVHNGIFLMFSATKKGARFAIVTDANHHTDWVSAILDNLTEPQMVNGQPVLLINYLGKRWDEALKKLLAL